MYIMAHIYVQYSVHLFMVWNSNSSRHLPAASCLCLQVHDNRPADVEAPAAPDVDRASCRDLSKTAIADLACVTCSTEPCHLRCRDDCSV